MSSRGGSHEKELSAVAASSFAGTRRRGRFGVGVRDQVVFSKVSSGRDSHRSSSRGGARSYLLKALTSRSLKSRC